mmetsp:Transcript_107188/g.272014  ORF Transcript_107188/g.272014 Transcript_107188/m.272014 type:complete len:341 (-) Transcript_107188:328-1350(-)
MTGQASRKQSSMKRVGFRWKSVSNLVSDTSIDDMEGLLVNVGIVAALMLSITSGALLGADMDQMILGDFRLKLLIDEQFRLVVNTALHIGFNSSEPFDFSQPLTLGMLDIEALLTQTRGAVRWTDHDKVREFDKAFHWIKNSLPDGLLYQSDFFGSSTVFLCAMISISVYTSIVISSFLLYTALVVSPVREMQKEGEQNLVLTAFNRVAMPVVSLLYLALIGASVAVFWGFIALMRVRCPNFALVEANLRQYALPIGGILCFGGLLSSIVAVVVCFHVAMKPPTNDVSVPIMPTSGQQAEHTTTAQPTTTLKLSVAPHIPGLVNLPGQLDVDQGTTTACT